MAQAIARTRNQQEQRNSVKKESLIAINWGRVRMVLQSLLLIAFPVAALWLSVENGFLYTVELASATIIITLVAFMRLAGERD